MLVCAECGEEFARRESGKGAQRRYCGERCKKRVRAKVRVRKCFYCRDSLTREGVEVNNCNFCSPACWQGWLNNDLRPALVVRACIGCDVELRAENPQKKLCGDPVCARAYAARRARERHAERMAGRPSTRTQFCGWCGGKIEVPQTAPKAKRYHPECKSDARRAHYRRKNVLRQGVGMTTKFRLGELGERDGWKCQLCGGPVVESLSGIHAEGPTVDHILPISKGGLDTWENVQLAHRRCNTAKGNRVE